MLPNSLNGPSGALEVLPRVLNGPSCVLNGCYQLASMGLAVSAENAAYLLESVQQLFLIAAFRVIGSI
jgi:hypothetical protein